MDFVLEEEDEEEFGPEMAIWDEVTKSLSGTVRPFKDGQIQLFENDYDLLEQSAELATNTPYLNLLKHHKSLSKAGDQIFQIYRYVKSEQGINRFFIKGYASGIQLSDTIIGTERHVIEKTANYFLCSNIDQNIPMAHNKKKTPLVSPIPIPSFNLFGINEDIDPTFHQRLQTQNDFGMLREGEKRRSIHGTQSTTVPLGTHTDYLIPTGEDIKKKDFVASIGFPAYQSSKLSKWVESMYKQWIPTTEESSTNRDETVQSITSQLNEMFINHTKTITVGSILDVHSQRIASVDYSSFPSMSGGAVVSLDGDNRLLGIHNGAVTAGANNNVFVTVHHPAFVHQYAQHVLPNLSEAHGEKLLPWLTKHIDIVEKYVSQDKLNAFGYEKYAADSNE